MMTHTPAVTFGEIGSLKEIFSEAKKLRRARHPVHVLIVEDDPLTRRIVTGSFKENYAMLSACDASNAVAEYLMHAPDVMFLDIGLPGADGFAVLDQIMLVDPDAFVVMFSSHDDTQNINKALTAGAKGFVSKPFKKETLKSFIQGSGVHHHKSCA